MSWRLSRLVSFTEDRRGSETCFGVFHRLTADAFSLSPQLHQLLSSLSRSGIADADLSLLRSRGEAQAVLQALIDGRFLVRANDARTLLAPYLDLPLIAPAMNPAVTCRDPDHPGTLLIRLKDTHQCRLPRDERPPELVEERVPESAARLLEAAEGNCTLGEALARCGFQRAGAWKAVDWLCRPERQLIRVVAPGADPRDLRRAAHYPIQSFFRSAAAPPALDADALSPATYYQTEVADADWQFDWVETTVSHAFRRPTEALGMLTYGERFCESLVAALPAALRSSPALDILEVGGGLGYFARDFLRRARAILPSVTLCYTLLDCTPALLQRQREILRDAAAEVRFLQQDAHQLSVAGCRFDIVIANEMIADLAVVRSARSPHASEGRWIHSGVFSFLGRLRQHLAPNGAAFLVEYGSLTGPPLISDHLNHVECSIDFGAVIQHAGQLGFHAELRGLPAFLQVRNVDMLCGQEERYLCLNRLLARRRLRLPFAAFCRKSLADYCGNVLAELSVGLLKFAPLERGAHFGPDLQQFQVLILRPNE